MKKILLVFAVSLLSGAITLGAYKYFFEKSLLNSSNSEGITTTAPIHKVSMSEDLPDFAKAAENAIHAVVHVKNVSYRQAPRNPILEYYYGYQGGQTKAQVGTGSGVIISEDGYIVTNNHVISGASELEITLNDNRSFKAKLIGTDEKMDIALLKIDSKEKLPFAVFADSDAINVGEWVLAVGNPYNLTSTVTAGIVSAKARNLSDTGIQSFIQTDAAVNPGNSGGALVNTRGELIGINTMISSTTGSYVGYSFAVPSNMARKIVEDIMKFGKVQQGVLGVQGFELNSQIASQQKLDMTSGFYVNEVTKDSGASKSGIKKGDVIVEVDGRVIRNYADLNGSIATKRPNDVVNVLFMRDGKKYTANVRLTKKEFQSFEYNGFEFENLTDNERKSFGIDYGVKIQSISNERFKAYEDDLKNAIVLGINGVKIKDIETANKLISSSGNSRIRLDIITQNGERIRVML